VALGVGTRLGAYEITGELGAGGMGEVYRATDSNLKREVAIKILPPAFADDADRVARFQREAEALAALNHPNIAQVFGLERSGETTALAMELVEGPTLADRIAEGPIPTDEALHIAMQIADALEAAHEQNIVHRDLKPANVKLRPDGTVKVLDFGIATAPESPLATSGKRSPTLLTPALTQMGVLLGTAAYMAPEQARGRAVDRRADIWAFGCVLYEMLTGQPAFGGEDVTTTLARVLEREANTAELPATVPAAVRHAIELCLEKNPSERIADIRDVKLALGGVFGTGAHGTADRDAGGRSWQRAVPTAAGLIAGLFIAAAIAWALWPAADLRPLNTFSYDLPQGRTVRFAGRPVLALSPDGRRFVYNAPGGLYVRSMGELEARLIPGTEAELTSPFFSPDGQSVAYWGGIRGIGKGPLKRIGVNGGAAVVVADGLANLFGASWSEDGTILYGQPQGIFRVSANGGNPELVIPAKEGESLYGPELLPDGDSVLFSTTTTGKWDDAEIVAQSLSTGQRTILVKGGSDAHYVAGRLVFALGDGLFGVAFAAERLQVSGGAVPLVQGVMRAAADTTGAANYAVASDGTLVYFSGTNTRSGWSLIWADRSGHVVGNAVSEQIENARDPRLSPNGERVALTRGPFTSGDIWVYDLGGRPPIPLAEEGDDTHPVWSPDGTRIAFATVLRSGGARADVYTVPADGSARDPVPLHADGLAVLPAAWSAQGELILARPIVDGNWDIVATSAEREGDVRGVVATPDDEFDPALSPDGRWLAYVSDRTGQTEIWVKRYPDGVPVRVSRDGGQEPVWSRDGKELFFQRAQGTFVMMSVAAQTTEEKFAFDPAVELFSGQYVFYPGPAQSSYAVAPDGRFLLISPLSSNDLVATSKIVVVQNWVEELKRKVPAK
jgi:eukaryotic-like serine/threonine-protein kinase